MLVKKNKLINLLFPVIAFYVSGVNAAPIDISDTPLFVTQSVPPLTMLVLGRDHKLFYEAYNDASDLDGDGNLDIRYNPTINYYGYFDSYKCYNYTGSRFDPASTTTTKKCSGNWSGDYLNYLTTARIDALRKVLYGGSRATDTTSETILQRTYVPQDAHSWGKEYTSSAVDGYDISEYTPYSQPTSGNRHLFANTTLLGGNNDPLLRVLTNSSYRIWEWVSIERPVANNRVLNGGSGPTVSPTDFVVRVKVCDNSVGLETNCQLYASGHYKPIGLLHQFGENGSMKFGLLSGSFTKNLSGGVLRKNVSDFNDEVNSITGQFSSTVGIVKTIDRLLIPNFSGNYTHNSSCGFIFNRAFYEGECRSWGNPIAEMFYESLRYFAGKLTPTSVYTYSGGDDATLGLPIASWQDPYASSANKSCAKPNVMVISDIYPSYDSDQIPGSYFSSYSGDLSPALNVASLGQTIWNTEKGGSSSHFIGQSAGTSDGAPTAKTVSSFGNIRGLAPEEPSKQGSYYVTSTAYYGTQNDLHTATGDQKVTTYAIALSSPLPSIDIPVNGTTVTIVPFAKSVGGCGGINNTAGNFQPTDTIVDFYVESLTATSGTFRVNFEDVEQGADHDMDAIVTYQYAVSGSDVTVTLTSTYAAGCIIQHMGYVISGTTADGTYLEVRDFDTASGSDPDYFLDTPPGESPGGNWNDSSALPLTTARTFTASGTGASLLKNPLWYAAKWGGFIDSNNNNIPDVNTEWDANEDGIPDTYFLVTNPSNLSAQLTAALTNIIGRSSSASSAALNSGSLNSNSRLYQAVFNSDKWTGQLLAFAVDPSTGDIKTNGSGPSGSLWDASASITSLTQNSKRIITYKPSNNTGVAFRWPVDIVNPTSSELDVAQTNGLRTDPDAATYDANGTKRLEYIRGDNSNEKKNGGTFRDRSTDLGDIVNSEPIVVGRPNFFYHDTGWPTGAAENTVAYSAFKSTHANRTEVLYVASNDGMLHAINTSDGTELLAYIPGNVVSNLNSLTSSNYSHKYFADGSANFNDVFYSSAWHTVLVGHLNKGGKAVYALDITDPANFIEANAASLVLWEFSDSDDVDMGYSFSQPAIVRLGNGKWAAVFGNGYNNTVADGNVSTTGNAVLYLVDIQTGALIKKIDTGIGMSEDPIGASRPNGLNTPAVVDTNGDYIADYVYAGDLFGNLWKFDITSSNVNQWKVAYKSGSTNKPLYVAKDASGTEQPITSRPTVSKSGIVGGVRVYFGTGKYLGTADKTDLSVQIFYAIEDDHTGVVAGRSDLLQQTIVSETTVSGYEYRITSNNQKTTSHKGWYLDLVFGTNYQGERVVSNSVLRNGKIIFSSMISSIDVCSFGGSGWLMELDTSNGSRLAYSPFDTNLDGKHNNSDLVTYGTNQVAVSGRKSKVGIIPSVSVLSTPGTEYKYTPGSSGSIEKITENPGPKEEGRQSWRQLL